MVKELIDDAQRRMDKSIEHLQKELASVRGEMRASIASMRTRLRDKEGNVAARDDFAMTDDLEKCTVCAYRRLCGRE